jgi:hypothetical protein
LPDLQVALGNGQTTSNPGRRADRLLAMRAGRGNQLQSFQIRRRAVVGVGLGAELEFMLKPLMADELLWFSIVPLELPVRLYELTPKGLLELESAGSTESAVALCAMWFDTDVLPLYTGVIEKASRACGYDPQRLDRKEHNNNNIDDEIIASIRGSRFVIADMTGHRGGLYYEAGFAHGLGLPVIFMLREDDQQDVHFDVRQQNFILWKPDEFPEARKRLENRIRATLGQGPLNPDRK